MSRYLLPCSCGKTHSVSTAQAGGTIACECGQSVPIPGLRGLRLLAPDDKDALSAPAKPPEAVNRMGVIFAVSLVLLLAGGGVAAYCGRYVALIDTADHTDAHLQWQMERLDKMPVDGIYDLWRRFTEKPLEFEMPHHVVAREVSGMYLRYTIIAGALAAAGLVGTIFSVLNSPGKSPRGPQKSAAGR